MNPKTDPLGLVINTCRMNHKEGTFEDIAWARAKAEIERLSKIIDAVAPTDHEIDAMLEAAIKGVWDSDPRIQWEHSPLVDRILSALEPVITQIRMKEKETTGGEA